MCCCPGQTPSQQTDQQQHIFKHERNLAEITTWAGNYMQAVVCCWRWAFLGCKDRKDGLGIETMFLDKYPKS